MSKADADALGELIWQHGPNAVVFLYFADGKVKGQAYGKTLPQGQAAQDVLDDICEALASGNLQFPEELKR